MASIMEPARNTMKNAPASIVLWPMIRPGTVAVSGINACTAAKQRNMTAKTMNKATMRASFHA